LNSICCLAIGCQKQQSFSEAVCPNWMGMLLGGFAVGCKQALVQDDMISNYALDTNKELSQ
jgi:hypothetical protein